MQAEVDCRERNEVSRFKTPRIKLFNKRLDYVEEVLFEKDCIWLSLIQSFSIMLLDFIATEIGFVGNLH